MVYRCWTVNCKTAGCGVCLTLHVIGPDEKFKHTLLPPVVPFSVTCCECEKPHEYSAADVEERNVENPSLTNPSIAFLDAIAKATWPDSDTAGFSDADSDEVAGVFWHKGGYILNSDGRRRDLEPDLPGWYYWYDGPDRYRYLHGPCNTKAEAEFYLEVNAA
jgi:hypothetical protein